HWRRGYQDHMAPVTTEQNRFGGGQQCKHCCAALSAKKTPDRAHGFQVGLFLAFEHLNKTVRQVVDASDQRNAPEPVIDKSLESPLQTRFHEQPEHVNSAKNGDNTDQVSGYPGLYNR